MNTFSTFGANYTLRYAVKCLFSRNKKGSREKLIKLLERKYKGKAILTYKCREAIGLALSFLSFPKGAFVAICDYSCKEVKDAIENAGMNYVLVPLEKGGLNFPQSSLDKASFKNPKIRVVLIQNTLGYPCDIEGIVKICRKRKFTLIEDIAHCAGASYKNGREVGTYGDFVCLSFSQNKILDTTAGGALIVRNSEFGVRSSELGNSKFKVRNLKRISNSRHPNFRRQLFDRIFPVLSYLTRNIYPLYLLSQKIIRVSKSFTDVGGEVHNLPEWYCPLILAKFKKLEHELSHRKKIAKIYATTINKNILSQKLVREIDISANFRFPIFVVQKKSLTDYLAKKRIYLDDSWYTVPGLTLPTHINISPQKAFEISTLINKWCSSGRGFKDKPN